MTLALEPVVIKGTRHGLLVCLREEADFSSTLGCLREKLQGDEGFLKGATVSVDLGWRELTEEQFGDFEAVLREHNVMLAGVLSTSLNTRTLAERRGHKAIIGRLGLAQHQGRALRNVRPPKPVETVEAATEPPAPQIVKQAPEPEPDPPQQRDQEETLYLKRNLRSGQKAMYPGHIVVMGDVNPGAELEAEGDIIVLGQLRGRAFAGCTGNPSAQIWALGMHPTQLRIGDAVYTGEKRRGKAPASLKAFLQGGEIVFEPMPIR